MAARYAPVPAPTNDVIRVAESAFPGVRIADPFAAGNRQDDRSETSDDEEQSDEDEQSEKARLTFEEGAADNDDQGWTTAKALSRVRSARICWLYHRLTLLLPSDDDCCCSLRRCCCSSFSGCSWHRSSLARADIASTARA